MRTAVWSPVRLNTKWIWVRNPDSSEFVYLTQVPEQSYLKKNVLFLVPHSSTYYLCAPKNTPWYPLPLFSNKSPPNPPLTYPISQSPFVLYIQVYFWIPSHLAPIVYRKILTRISRILSPEPSKRLMIDLIVHELAIVAQSACALLTDLGNVLMCRLVRILFLPLYFDIRLSISTIFHSRRVSRQASSPRHIIDGTQFPCERNICTTCYSQLFIPPISSLILHAFFMTLS
jgi:hypothetical protein